MRLERERDREREEREREPANALFLSFSAVSMVMSIRFISQRANDVDAMYLRRIDVSSTSSRRRVPAGIQCVFLLYFSMNYRDFSVKLKLIISLFQTVKLSLSISLFQKIGFSCNSFI